MKNALVIIALAIALSLAFSLPSAQAADTMEALDAILAGEHHVSTYRFPDVAPEINLFAGYRFTELHGDPTALPYELMRDNPIFSVEARVLPFPHRFYFLFDYTADLENFGDLRYAYGDGVFVRWLGRSTYHSLPRFTLAGPRWAVASADQWADTDPWLHGRADALYLRLKAPGYATHAYADLWSYLTEGSVQDRSLLGSGWYNRPIRTTQRRDVSMRTYITTVGVNSHLGPLEAELSHSHMKLDPKEGTLEDTYSATAFRPSGTYAHDQAANVEGGTTTVKAHTSYTGGLVGSATFARRTMESQITGAETVSTYGAGSITWMPDTNWTLYARFRHKEVHSDVHDSAWLVDAASGAAYAFSVKPAMAVSTDTASLTAKYRASENTTLRMKYVYEEIGRKGHEVWGMSSSTWKNTAGLSLNLRPMDSLQIDGEYTYRDVKNPATAMDADFSHQASVTATLRPAPKLWALASYDYSRERRLGIGYDGESEDNARRERFLRRSTLSATYAPASNTAIIGSYAFMRDESRQDLGYDFAGVTRLAPRALYRTDMQVFSMQGAVQVSKALSTSITCTHTLSQGELDSGNSDIGGLAALVEYKFSDTSVGFAGTYAFCSDLQMDMALRYGLRQDAYDNEVDEVSDAEYGVATVRVSAKW